MSNRAYQIKRSSIYQKEDFVNLNFADLGKKNKEANDYPVVKAKDINLLACIIRKG